jgi:hypothetical protein
MTRQANPGISDEDVQKVLDDIERDRAEDPLLLNETIDQIPAQYMVTSLGANLEMGLYICQATGSFPYTNVKFRWREILAAKQELDVTAQTWSPLTNAFQQLTFKFLDQVDSGFACTLRKEGRLEGFRSYLRVVGHRGRGSGRCQSGAAGAGFSGRAESGLQRRPSGVERDRPGFAQVGRAHRSRRTRLGTLLSDDRNRICCHRNRRNYPSRDEATRVSQKSADVGIHRPGKEMRSAASYLPPVSRSHPHNGADLTGLI